MSDAMAAATKGYMKKVFSPFQRYDRDFVAGTHVTIL